MLNIAIQSLLQKHLAHPYLLIDCPILHFLFKQFFRFSFYQNHFLYCLKLNNSLKKVTIEFETK